MAYNYESELSEAFGQLLKIETDYNVIIYIGKEPNFKEFHAHSNVLRCRSEYFDKILSDDSIEKKDGKYIIKKQNISPQAFNVVLKYLYTGKIDIANKTKTEISNIMTVSDELITNFQNARVAYSNDNGYSISCISECGPFFGGSDLYLNHCNGPDFWCAMKPFSYPSLGLPWKIIADDYEVFQVIKK
ncbi:unnamed protein product [Rhizophagus irregularis]|nr:unnamed protein product [Rhizophagus irregularis]